MRQYMLAHIRPPMPLIYDHIDQAKTRSNETLQFVWVDHR